MKQLVTLLAGGSLLAGCTTMNDNMAVADTTPDTAAEAAAQIDAIEVTTDNPLLADWTGPFEGVPPWDRLDPELFPSAFEAAMAEVELEVHAVRDNPAPATFDNVLVPMMLAGDKIDRLFALWGVQTSNLANDRVRAIDAEWSPKISAFYDGLFLDPKLFARYKAVYDTMGSTKLNTQQKRIVTRAYDNFVRDGANLPPAEKEKLIALNSELSKLFTDFGGNVVKDEETYVFIADESRLSGLPDSFKASLAAAATAAGKPGQWAVKNTRSSMQPFLQYANDRALREAVWNAYVLRGDNGDAEDNKAIIAKILKLRQQRAKLLGFDNHAQYRMADTMAKTPAKAMDLMMKVWPAAKQRVAEEVADMQAIADQNGDKIAIKPWDYRYYMEKVKKAKYDLDESEVKPYLQLDNMVAAMFDSAGRLYDLGFKENTGSVPVFHPDVRTFEVIDKRDGSNVGLLYLDNFARDGKRSGAWMTTYRSQQGLGGDRNVLAANNNNFTKGANGEPTLISLDDASTLFHEFGHGIHYLLQDVYYPALSGSQRDFVEYPSQVNENWLMTPYVLQTYAKHYKTGEAMPQALIDKIFAAEKFNQGFATVEYLSDAIVDMKLHQMTSPPSDIAAYEKKVLAEIGMPDTIALRHRLPQFNHLFTSDAYSAGYYSYLWSEVMDADTWAAFTEAGSPWDRSVADRFRAILLATGNETDRADAYRAFRGRDPDVKALLERRGFPTGE